MTFYKSRSKALSSIIFKVAISFGALLFLISFAPAALAQSQYSFECKQGETEAECRSRLERNLALIEGEIAQQEVILNDKRQENQSLERDIAILNAEIRKSELAIQARNLAVRQLSQEIFTREEIIESLSEKMEREKQSLAKLLRKKNELDAYSVVEIMLASENISTFFEDLDSVDTLNSALNNSFDVIRDTQDLALGEKQQLATKQVQEAQLAELQRKEKGLVEEKKGEKQVVLTVSKGEEAEYQQVLDQQKQTASQIRARLFELKGTGAIPFGDAVQFAKEAGALTGVRPALILAVFKQETNIGENVGSCNYKNNMHPDRDIPVFLELMGRLGYDPDSRVVSCQPSYGWGGAMGPAQFIPSTWILYEGKLKSLLGYTPDPWRPKDAFTAASLLLAENGATNQSYAAERLAALRYFAGWGNANNPSYAFYGDSVMRFAEQMQADMNAIGE